MAVEQPAGDLQQRRLNERDDRRDPHLGRGEGGTVNDCALNTTDIGCHVATIVVSPSTPVGSTSGTLFNHYSLLSTTEELLGLPKLGLAASNATMTSAFNL